MQSLFNSPDVTAIQDRIYKLQATSAPLWGKMNAAQMLAHCIRPLQVASGELKLKRGLFALLFGKLMKRLLITEKPYRQHMPTAPQFVIHEKDRNFEEERRLLIAEIHKFNQSANLLNNRVHPFFGKMSVKEWDIMQWKHLDHHLRQFGV